LRQAAPLLRQVPSSSFNARVKVSCKVPDGGEAFSTPFDFFQTISIIGR
jgi:hypothetical protein